MKKLISLFILLTSIFLISCNDYYKPPKTELCNIFLSETLKDSSCICSDPRLPEGEQENDYPIQHCQNYLATSPSDFQIKYNWVYERLEDLKECETNCYDY